MAIRIVVKVGNEEGDFRALKHGMIVCTIDPSEPLSDHMKRVFAIIDVPDSWQGTITSSMQAHEYR